jgi:hypothetical protein
MNQLCEAFESGANRMVYRRSAMALLITCLVLCAPSRGSEIADSAANRAASLVAGNFTAPLSWSHSARPARGATLSQFTPWKTRIKSVLAETYQRIIEERDLGSAILPAQLFTAGTVELVSSPHRMRPPLRC